MTITTHPGSSRTAVDPPRRLSRRGRTGRRVVAAGTGVAALALAGATFGAPAQASTEVTLNSTVAATTYNAAMKKSLTTTGSSTATLDLATRKLSSAIALQPFTTRLDVLGLPLATVVVEQVPIGPSVGTLEADNTIRQVQKADLRIKKISPVGLPNINLVPSTCKTKTPATIPVSGKLTNIFEPLTLSGTYTIPEFTGCGLLTPIITKMTSGPGNTIKLVLTPR